MEKKYKDILTKIQNIVKEKNISYSGKGCTLNEKVITGDPKITNREDVAVQAKYIHKD